MTDEQFNIIVSLLKKVMGILESIDCNTDDISYIKTNVSDIKKALEK